MPCLGYVAPVMPGQRSSECAKKPECDQGVALGRVYGVKLNAGTQLGGARRQPRQIERVGHLRAVMAERPVEIPQFQSLVGPDLKPLFGKMTEVIVNGKAAHKLGLVKQRLYVGQTAPERPAVPHARLGDVMRELSPVLRPDRFEMVVIDHLPCPIDHAQLEYLARRAGKLRVYE